MKTNKKILRLLCCLVAGLMALPAHVFAQTEIPIWDRSITVHAQDRIALKVDDVWYQLPQDARLVPAKPQESTAIIVFGAAGDLAALADGIDVQLHPDWPSTVFRRCYALDRTAPLPLHPKAVEWLPRQVSPYPGQYVTVPDAVVDYLNKCLVAAMIIGPGVSEIPLLRHLVGFNQRLMANLTSLPPRHYYDALPTHEVDGQIAQTFLTHGQIADGRYFVTRHSTGPDVVVILDMDGPVFGPGPVVMECDGGYGEPKISSHTCGLFARAKSEMAAIELKVFSPSVRNIAGVTTLQTVMFDRLGRFFVP